VVSCPSDFSTKVRTREREPGKDNVLLPSGLESTLYEKVCPVTLSWYSVRLPDLELISSPCAIKVQGFPVFSIVQTTIADRDKSAALREIPVPKMVVSAKATGISRCDMIEA